MKQKILVGILIFLILVVGGIWAYLFFSPDTGAGIFANFGQESEPEQRPTNEPQPSVVDTKPTTRTGEPQALRQLTTRPVAAATFIDGGIRYVERGTGYIYDIMFANGNEVQVSNTTVPRVVEAVFSESGSRVAMTSEKGGTQNAIVGTLTRNDAGEGIIDGTSLPSGAHDLDFTDSGETLRFAVTEGTDTIGYTYTIAEQTQTTLFSIPLTQVEIIWGDDATYAYTTPSAEQYGYVYEIVGDGELSYLTSGAPGLTAAHMQGETFITTASVDAIDTTRLQANGTREETPLRLFLEKCVGASNATSTLYCGAPETIPPGTYPDDWYKGTISFSDTLWEYEIGGSVTEIVDLLETSGREIDISAIYQDAAGEYLAFINKNDDSLWLYELDMN